MGIGEEKEKKKKGSGKFPLAQRNHDGHKLLSEFTQTAEVVFQGRQENRRINK
jgi:hypothetical protein